MSVKVYFDLDGTVFDLYGKSNWLEILRTEQIGAFQGSFLPEIDLNEFYATIEHLSIYGVQFAVISWLPMQASPEYEEICRQEKNEWILENLPFVSEVSIVPYGIPKQDCIIKRAQRMILLDDNAEVCEMWRTAKQRQSIQITKDWTVVHALKDLLKEFE